jgi:hypothetical protein
VIRSPKGNAAEMVAEKLDKKLRESLRDTRSGLFTSDLTQSFGYEYFITKYAGRNTIVFLFCFLKISETFVGSSRP